MRLPILLITVVMLATACAADDGTTDTTRPSTTLEIGQLGFVEGTVTAGPQCPVEINPPDPACQDQPVAGAIILVRGPRSDTVVQLVTDELGRFSTPLAPGLYVIEPQPVDGLLGTASPAEVTIEAQRTAVVDFSYDTGIR
jgi:hypothetical protein